jgi:oxygen-independent coproporphyrinogen-3 oxidase
MNQPVAIYIHIPFCISKCGYCDFNSYAMRGEIVQRTVDAIKQEIRKSPWHGRPAKTIFFGGGTPTFLSKEQLVGILQTVLEFHPLTEDAEITSEANPGTADATKFEAMRKAGFNRLSIGAQSFLDSDLHRLGRAHRATEIVKAVEIAHSAGFDNLSLDLMFALPGQTIEAWGENLQRAMELEPQHLSLYCLTIEPDTPFARLAERGTLVQPEEQQQVDMYDLCDTVLNKAGLERYEISNFSREGRECQHNLCYWRGEEYLAYGPGAVGVTEQTNPTPQSRRIRYTNLKAPRAYCEAIENETDRWQESEILLDATLKIEKIMLGIRLTEGIDVKKLEIEPRNLDPLIQKGWVEVVQDRLRLTPQGRHFCNDVAAILI